MNFVKWVITLLVMLWLAVTTWFLQGSWEQATKSCQAWATNTSLSCKTGFLPSGMKMLIRQKLGQGHTAASNAPLVSEPEPANGKLMLAAFASAYLLGALILFSVFQRRNTHDSRSKVPSDDKWALHFIALLMIVAAAVLNQYFTSRLEPGGKRHEASIRGESAIELGDRDTLAALMIDLESHRLSPKALETRVKTGLAQKQITPAALAKVFNLVLGLCQSDYVDVLLKFPMQPHPNEYDLNYMQSNYASLTDPKCDKIYERMGWSRGCEVPAKNDSCLDFSDFYSNYEQKFRQAMGAGHCESDSDCVPALQIGCGEPMVYSKRDANRAFASMAWSLRCPLRKRQTLCEKSHTTYLACAPESLKPLKATCQESTCRMVEVKPGSMATPSTKLIETPLQPAFFQSETECVRTFTQTEKAIGGRTADEPLSTYEEENLVRKCRNENFEEMTQIVLAQVTAIKPGALVLARVENLGPIPMPSTFEMPWPPPMQSPHSHLSYSLAGQRLRFETPRVGEQAILAFLEADGTAISQKPLNPIPYYDMRRRPTPELLQYLRAQAKFFPNQSQLQGILRTRQLISQAPCQPGVPMVGDLGLRAILALPQRACATPTQQDSLFVTIAPSARLKDVRELSAACGVVVNRTHSGRKTLFLELNVQTPNHPGSQKAVLKCLKRSRSVTSAIFSATLGFSVGP